MLLGKLLNLPILQLSYVLSKYNNSAYLEGLLEEMTDLMYLELLGSYLTLMSYHANSYDSWRPLKCYNPRKEVIHPSFNDFDCGHCFQINFNEINLHTRKYTWGAWVAQ